MEEEQEEEEEEEEEQAREMDESGGKRERGWLHTNTGLAPSEVRKGGKDRETPLTEEEKTTENGVRGQDPE